MLNVRHYGLRIPQRPLFTHLTDQPFSVGQGEHVSVAATQRGLHTNFFRGHLLRQEGCVPMRMDNETYRLRVEGLIARLKKGDNGEMDPNVRAQLEELAVMPRKARYFLKALASSGQDQDVQVHFYRHIMTHARPDDIVSDLERHVRHSFYEAREEAKQILSRLTTADVLPVMFRIISATEEGWLAGELIRIVLAAPIEELRTPLRESLYSKDYLLQCLAIYLIGKLADEELMEELAQFYCKPVGEKIERLEKKAYEALLQGAQECAASLLVSWLKARQARLRELALTALESRRVPESVVDLIRLVLIDPRTRNQAADVVLRYKDIGLFDWKEGDPVTQPVIQLVSAAKREPLLATLRALMREESPAVREVGVELVGLLRESSGEVTGQVRRLAIEDPVPTVQMAALRTLSKTDVNRLIPCLIDIFSDYAYEQGSQQLIDESNRIMEEVLTPEQVAQVQAGIEQKRERREAALERFAGTVEWWRHEG